MMSLYLYVSVCLVGLFFNALFHFVRLSCPFNSSICSYFKMLTLKCKLWLHGITCTSEIRKIARSKRNNNVNKKKYNQKKKSEKKTNKKVVTNSNNETQSAENNYTRRAHNRYSYIYTHKQTQKDPCYAKKKLKMKEKAQWKTKQMTKTEQFIVISGCWVE